MHCEIGKQKGRSVTFSKKSLNIISPETLTLVDKLTQILLYVNEHRLYLANTYATEVLKVYISNMMIMGDSVFDLTPFNKDVQNICNAAVRDIEKYASTRSCAIQ